MAGTIGGVACDYLHLMGKLDPNQRIEAFQSDGIDGTGFHDLGEGAGNALFEVIKVDLSADVETWSSSIADLKGAGLITATDDRGVVYTNIQVMNITNLVIRDILDGGVAKLTGIHILTCVLTE